MHVVLVRCVSQWPWPSISSQVTNKYEHQSVLRLELSTWHLRVLLAYREQNPNRPRWTCMSLQAGELISGPGQASLHNFAANRNPNFL